MGTAPAYSGVPVSEHVPIRHKRPPLTALTPLRFFAAIYVVLFHVRHPGWFGNLPVFRNFLDSGYNGVTLFFVLSGFILVYNYPEVRDRPQFWTARFARVYPAYMLALLLVLLLATAMPPHLSIHRLFAPATLSVLLLQAWWTPAAFTLNSPAWTLSVEAFFYGCFPFLVKPLRAVCPARFAWCALPWFLLCATPGVLGAAPGVLGMQASPGDLPTRLASFLEGPFPLIRLPSFVIGMYAGAAFAGRPAPGRSRAALLAGVCGSGLLLGMAPQLCWRPLRTAALSVAFAATVYGMASLRSRLLASHVMQTAGEISYGMYILQVPVLRICLGVQRRLFPLLPEQEILFIPVLIVFACLVFFRVENPARLLIRSWLRPRPALASGG